MKKAVLRPALLSGLLALLPQASVHAQGSNSWVIVGPPAASAPEEPLAPPPAAAADQPLPPAPARQAEATRSPGRPNEAPPSAVVIKTLPGMTAPAAAPPPAVLAQLEPVMVPLTFEPSWLDMPEVDATSFPMFRREAIAGAARAADAAGWLDYGRTMFNGGFFPEAMSGLERAVQLGLPAQGALREHAALLALGLEAAGRGACRCDGLQPRAEAGASFFAVLMDLSQRAKPDPAVIAALSGGLAHQSQAVAGFTGPQLFNAAVRADDLALAGRLLQVLTEAGAGQPSALLVMRGAYAEMRDMEAEAFGLYVDALPYHDEHAFQARLRIADMAIRKPDSAALEVVRDFLIEGLQEWHGGATGLAMLTRLAAVSEALLDAPAALEAMARIRADYPQAPQAPLAAVRAEIIMEKHANALEAGQVSLEAYSGLMRRLRGGLADLQAWVPARSALAQSFERQGYLLAAAAEYADIRADVQSYDSPATPAQQAELLAHQVRLLQAIGRSDEALIEVRLRHDLVARDPTLRRQSFQVMDGDAFNALLAANPDLVLSGPDYLYVGRLRFAAGDLAGALRDWGSYLAGGGQLAAADAANYVYAKYKVENPPELALDGLVASGDRAYLDAMVAALSDPMRDLTALDLISARQTIDDAAAAVAAAQSAKN